VKAKLAPPADARDAVLLALARAQLFGLNATMRALRRYRLEAAIVDAANKALGGKVH
jgi:hypothetical protein